MKAYIVKIKLTPTTIIFLINQLPGSFSYFLGLEIICFSVLYCAYYYGRLAILGPEIAYISRGCEFNKHHYRCLFLTPIFFPETNNSAQFSFATGVQLTGSMKSLPRFIFQLSLLAFWGCVLGGDILPFW